MVMSDSIPPAEWARKSQLRNETSESSAAKQARTVAAIRSRGQAGRHPRRREPGPDRERVPLGRLGRVPGRVDGDLLGHGVHARDGLAGAEERDRADARDVAAVTAHLPASGQHVVAVDEGLERGDADLLGQRVHALMMRADEAAPHVDRDSVAAGLSSNAAADAVRASRTTTERPAWLRRRAAVRPASPAPTMQTSASVVVLAPLLAVVLMAPPRLREGNMRAARM